MHFLNFQIVTNFFRNHRGIFFAGRKMLFIFFGLITIFIVLVFYFYGFGEKAKLSQIVVGGKEFSVWVADTPASRTKGLSGKPSMNENQGMLFVFDDLGDYGFWMKGMNFPLDLIWIKKDRIVGFSQNVLPEPGKSLFGLKIYHPPEAVDKVLELNTGMVERDGIRVGDVVKLKS